MSSDQDIGCFACGQAHPFGLRLEFQTDTGTRSAESTTVLGPGFAGADGIAHGGIVATMLDEAMVYASRCVEPVAATAELQVRYRRPTPVGRELAIRGRVVSVRSRAILCEGQILMGETVLAEGRATLIRLPLGPS